MIRTIKVYKLSVSLIYIKVMMCIYTHTQYLYMKYIYSIYVNIHIYFYIEML